MKVVVKCEDEKALFDLKTKAEASNLLTRYFLLNFSPFDLTLN